MPRLKFYKTFPDVGENDKKMKLDKFFYITIIILMVLIFSLPLVAQGFFSSFKDTTDNAFDLSDWLLRRKGFLVSPALITEPAVGYGGAAAFMFFHSSFLERKGPPNISGMVGAYTESKTWIFGGFHAGFWNQDNIRYTGALFRLNLNVKFYGSGLIFKDPVKFSMDSWMLFQQIKFRVKHSNFFLGTRYFLYHTQNTFEIPINIPDFNGIKFNSTLSELTALVNYESRDNIFTPQKGLFAEVKGTYSDEWLGGEGLYGRLGLSCVGFVPLEGKFYLGVRLESLHSLGEVPFWARPSVSMRGVPAMKYQNKHISVMEVELTYNVYKRWYLNVFTGMGNAYPNIDDFDKGKPVRNLGTGFRYKIARLLGLNMGMDFAWSNEDFAFYVILGHAWLR